MAYTCHATATDCASAPTMDINRAAWYSRKSLDWNALAAVDVMIAVVLPPSDILYIFTLPRRRRDEQTKAWPTTAHGFSVLSSKIDFVLSFDDAGIAGQGKLRLVVLIERLHQACLGVGQRCLGLDHREVVRDSGLKADGGLLQLLRGQIDVAAGYLDQLRR